MSSGSAEPFETFASVYKILVFAGYYKLLDAPEYGLKRFCHEVYRCLAFLVAVLVNLRHITFIMQHRGNSENVFEALLVEIPHTNLLSKYLTLNMQCHKIEKIHDLLKNPIFAAKTKKDEELMMKSKQDMHRLYNVINIGLTVATVLWPTYYFTKRYFDEASVVPSFVPFRTDTWSRFTWSVLIEVIPVLWIGYGHLALDCLVVTFYAQAQVQFKIIKYNLEHLFDRTRLNSSLEESSDDDEQEEDLKNDFIHYVQRYEKLVWFIKEIENVFNVSMSFQFMTSTASLCIIIFIISATDSINVQFIFLVSLLMIVATQVFLYCYFGNLVQYESQSVNDSIYLSDWVSSSSHMRGLMLIAMLRWSKPLAPTVSGIVPLSLDTFVSIARFAYSIYAVLRTRQA